MALLSSPLPASADSYSVVQGDTLSKIARQYQTTVDQLIRYNQLPSDRLSIGQVITIPEATPASFEGGYAGMAASQAAVGFSVVAAPQPAGGFLGVTAPQQAGDYLGVSAPELVGDNPGISASQPDNTPVSQLYVTVPSLHVRVFPSIESQIIGKVTYGMQLEVVDSGPEWIQINYNGSSAYVSAAYVTSSLPSSKTESDLKQLPVVSAEAESLIPLIKPLLGIPYRLGGTTPDGFDCSGFTSYVLEQLGVSLPRTSEEQFASGQEVSYEEAIPGDLLFYDTLNKGKVSHVALYLGNGMIVHANGETVRFEKEEYMHKLYPFYGVKRYLAFK